MSHQWNDDDRNVKVYLNNAMLGDVEAPSWLNMPLKTNLHKEIAASLDEKKWECFNEVEFVDYAFEAPAIVQYPVVHELVNEHEQHENEATSKVAMTPHDDYEVNNEIENGAWKSKFMYT